MISLSTASRGGFTVAMTVPIEQNENMLSKLDLWHIEVF